MARNAEHKSKTGNGAPADGAPEGIDQVRDILFGGQMRMVDARLQGLEERVRHEQAALRADFDRQIAELDGSIKKEFARHAERLASERTKRIEDLKAMSAEFREALKSLERRHQNLEEAAGLADAELRDQLLKQGTALSTELARTAERLATELDRVGKTLQAEKLDTTALATGLTELAAQLTGAGRPSSKRAPRG
jgi:chromosome segregation ATPase